MRGLSSLSTGHKEKSTRNKAMASDSKAMVMSVSSGTIVTITGDAPAMVQVPGVEAMKSDAGIVTIGTIVGQDQRIRTK